jgi:hypothetical protein
LIRLGRSRRLVTDSGKSSVVQSRKQKWLEFGAITVCGGRALGRKRLPPAPKHERKRSESDEYPVRPNHRWAPDARERSHSNDRDESRDRSRGI